MRERNWASCLVTSLDLWFTTVQYNLRVPIPSVAGVEEGQISLNFSSVVFIIGCTSIFEVRVNVYTQIIYAEIRQNYRMGKGMAKMVADPEPKAVQ